MKSTVLIVIHVSYLFSYISDRIGDLLDPNSFNIAY